MYVDRNNMNIKGIASVNGDVELENMTNHVESSIMDISELANGTREPKNNSMHDINNDPGMDTNTLLREVQSVKCHPCSPSNRDRHLMSLDDVQNDQTSSATTSPTTSSSSSSTTTTTCMDVSDNQTFSTIDHQSLLGCSARDRTVSVESTCSTFVRETLMSSNISGRSDNNSCSTSIAETVTSSNSGQSYHSSTTTKSFHTNETSNKCLESPMTELAKSMDFHIATMATSRRVNRNRGFSVDSAYTNSPDSTTSTNSTPLQSPEKDMEQPHWEETEARMKLMKNFGAGREAAGFHNGISQSNIPMDDVTMNAGLHVAITAPFAPSSSSNHNDFAQPSQLSPNHFPHATRNPNVDVNTAHRFPVKTELSPQGTIFPLGLGTCLDTGPRRRERYRNLKEGRPEECAVCGEPSNGMYFGAMVCLPCKSFFIRCTKEETPKFQCMGNKSCNVERGNRMRCQYCRFNRCLSAGMCRKEKPEVVEPGEGQDLCRVCKDIANGIHFGVTTCEGCKKFFRRALKEAHLYTCKYIQNCELNPRNRNACRFCRYHRCLNVGMSREAIRMGRPKKVKATGSYTTHAGYSRPFYYPQYSPGADSGFSSDSSRNTPDGKDPLSPFFPTAQVKKEPGTEECPDILEELLNNHNLDPALISLAPAEIDTDDINDILAALGQNGGSAGTDGEGDGDGFSAGQGEEEIGAQVSAENHHTEMNRVCAVKNDGARNESQPQNRDENQLNSCGVNTSDFAKQLHIDSSIHQNANANNKGLIDNCTNNAFANALHRSINARYDHHAQNSEANNFGANSQHSSNQNADLINSQGSQQLTQIQNNPFCSNVTRSDQVLNDHAKEVEPQQHNIDTRHHLNNTMGHYLNFNSATSYDGNSQHVASLGQFVNSLGQSSNGRDQYNAARLCRDRRQSRVDNYGPYKLPARPANQAFGMNDQTQSSNTKQHYQQASVGINEQPNLGAYAHRLSGQHNEYDDRKRQYGANCNYYNSGMSPNHYSAFVRPQCNVSGAGLSELNRPTNFPLRSPQQQQPYCVT